LCKKLLSKTSISLSSVVESVSQCEINIPNLRIRCYYVRAWGVYSASFFGEDSRTPEYNSREKVNVTSVTFSHLNPYCVRLAWKKLNTQTQAIYRSVNSRIKINFVLFLTCPLIVLLVKCHCVFTSKLLHALFLVGVFNSAFYLYFIKYLRQK